MYFHSVSQYLSSVLLVSSSSNQPPCSHINAKAPTTAAPTIATPCTTYPRAASPVLAAALALLTAELSDALAALAMLLAAVPVADIDTDIDAALAVAPAVELAVLAQVATVGRLVTPAGTQMPSANLRVADTSAALQTLETQQVMAEMKPASEQMHLGSRLQEAGMAFMVQF